MTNSFNAFQSDMTRVNGLFAIYDHLRNELHLGNDITSEILRNQWMYAVSAMDKFLHEVVRVGFIESYKGIRSHTAKYESLQLPIPVIEKLIVYSNPSFVPSSIDETVNEVLSNEIARQTHIVAYQHPDKINEGLSIVWDEVHKFQKLATSMGWTMVNNDKILRQKLILISDRRNQIVHQSDMLHGCHTKQSITRTEVEDAVEVVSKFCKAVYDEVHI